MEINILFLVVVAAFGAGTIWGWRRGLLESVIRIVSCILGILVLLVVAKGIGSFLQKSYVKVMMALFLLFAIRTIHRLIKFLTDTFRLVRAIPVGRLADKLAGAILGFIEAIFVIWLCFLLIGVFDIMNLNTWILQQVEQSQFLTMLYYSNYLVELLKTILL